MLRLILVASVSLSAQAVEGLIVDSVSGAGIAGAVMTLSRDADKSFPGIRTDAQGRFRIEGIPDGIYTVTYNAVGFFPLKKVVGLTHLEARMQPVGRISGRVLDAAGTPVQAASVWFHWENSLCVAPVCLGYYRMRRTDEKGEYSIADLDAPGSWVVSATAPATLKAPDSDDGERLGWAQTFYPGVADPRDAVRVMTGSEQFLDIKLAAIPVHRVRGTVLDERGDPVAKAVVTLSKGFVSESVHENSKEDGTFEFASVPNADWMISTKLSRDGALLWAMQAAPVKGRDVERIELRLTGPFSVHGKIVMEVPEGAAAPKAPGVMLAYNGGSGSIESVETQREFLDSAAEGKNGFAIQKVYPGQYMIVANEPPPGYYVESIRLGDREAVEADVPISSGFQTLTVIYKLGGGTVRGDCGAGRVVLIPTDAMLRRPDFTRFAICGAGGTFEIPAVRPGEYYGLAMVGDSLAFDDGLLAQAAKVTVRANESTVLDIGR